MHNTPQQSETASAPFIDHALATPRTESPWKDAEKLREIAWEKVMTRPRLIPFSKEGMTTMAKG